GTSADNPGEVSVLPPPSLTPGSRVRVNVLVPYGSMPGLQAKAFVQDAAWQWADGGATRLTPGVWTELTVAVPPHAQLPLQARGLHFEPGSPGAGPLYGDAVREVRKEYPPLRRDHLDIAGHYCSLVRPDEGKVARPRRRAGRDREGHDRVRK